MRSLALSAILPAALALGLGIAHAAPAKNLQIFPKGTDTKALKEDMKRISKALGVQCDHCHDMSALDKDTEHKQAARAMLKMTSAINAQLKAAKFKQPVTCNTCHQGAAKPKPDPK